MTSDLTQQLYDIYGMSHIPWWQQQWVLACAGACLLLFVLGSIWYIFRRIRAKKRVMTPWDKALLELHGLENQGFVSVIYSKELYTALTNLLKRYVHERYGFDLVGKTDDETIIFLEQHYFPADLLESVRTIFSASVIMKFSNACAMKTKIEQDFAASRTIIYKTIPLQNNK